MTFKDQEHKPFITAKAKSLELIRSVVEIIRRTKQSWGLA